MPVRSNPPLGKLTLKSLPTPILSDRIKTALHDSRAALFTIPAPGTPHPDDSNFLFTTAQIAPDVEPGGEIYRFFYVNDRANQNSYNYSVDFPYESKDYPRYTRTYVVLRSAYTPAADLSADPVNTSLKLVEQKLLRLEDPILDALFVGVQRVYEPIPGPVLNNFQSSDPSRALIRATGGSYKTTFERKVVNGTPAVVDFLTIESTVKGAGTVTAKTSYTKLDAYDVLVTRYNDPREENLEVMQTEEIVPPNTQPLPNALGRVESRVEVVDSLRSLRTTTTVIPNGSQGEAVGGIKSISALSTVNPLQGTFTLVLCAGHGFNTGDTVLISGVGGTAKFSPPINGYFVVEKVSTDLFRIPCKMTSGTLSLGSAQKYNAVYPWIHSFKIREHSGDVWLTAKRKRLIADFLGSTPLVQVGVVTGEATTETTVSSAPRISSSRSLYGIVGEAFSYQIIATNSPTSFAATGLGGTGLSIDSSTGLITGNLASSFALTPITISASNGTGSDTVEATLTSLASAATEWSPTTLYSVGDSVVPPGDAPAGGWQFEFVCTRAGTSGASFHPVSTVGNGVTPYDGTPVDGIVWKYDTSAVSWVRNWAPSRSYVAGDIVAPAVGDTGAASYRWKCYTPGPITSITGGSGTYFNRTVAGQVTEQTFSDYVSWTCLSKVGVSVAPATPTTTTTVYDGMTATEREDIDALVTWEVVTSIPKSIYYSEGTALVSYEARTEVFPAYAEFVSGFDGSTAYQALIRKGTRADVVQRKVSTWWVVSDTEPSIHVDSVITDTILDQGREISGVLHDKFTNGFAVPSDPKQIQPLYAFTGVPANCDATKPSKTEYVSSWIGTLRVREFTATPELYGKLFRCVKVETVML